MAVLYGTESGVYRTQSLDTEDPIQVLETGRVMRVSRFEPDRGIFACSSDGLYRTRDGGQTWSELPVPREEVYSALVSPDGDRVYAGTHPAHLYVSEDNGDSWRELEGLQDLPSRDEWHTPRHRNEAHVRSLGAHADAPDRVIAGVEVGGVHVSEDRGETWSERRDGLQDDVHHVAVLSPEEFIASCGGGLYRTGNAGRSWSRLDEDLPHRYFREAIVHGGRLYAAAARGPPGTWSGADGADAALFVSDDDGESFSTMSYPGEPNEVILAWAARDDALIAGTNDGRVLTNDGGRWQTAGSVPAGIRSLCWA